MKNFYGYPAEEAMQLRPDLLAFFQHSIYAYKQYLTLDQKHHTSNIVGRNQSLTLSLEDYSDLLSQFKQKLISKYHGSNTQVTIDALDELENSAGLTFETHLDVWVKHLDKFPNKWHPPLRLEKTFDYSELTPEVVALLKNGECEIQRISDQLYVLNVSEKPGTFPEAALDIFNNSTLQYDFKPETSRELTEHEELIKTLD